MHWDIGGYREQLFDMVNDRGETNNLASKPAYAAELQRHRGVDPGGRSGRTHRGRT